MQMRKIRHTMPPIIANMSDKRRLPIPIRASTIEVAELKSAADVDVTSVDDEGVDVASVDDEDVVVLRVVDDTVVVSNVDVVLNDDSFHSDNVVEGVVDSF